MHPQYFFVKKASIIGEKILEAFTNATTNLNFKNFTENNIFLFDVDLDIKNTEFDENLANNICEKLNETFEMNQKIIDFLVNNNKKAKFIFLTTNSKFAGISTLPVSPIYEEAIHAFVKSLTKEFNPFDLSFYALNIESISELLEKKDLLQYRKRTKNIALKKSPTKLDDLILFLQELINSKSNLLSGTVFSIGEGTFS